MADGEMPNKVNAGLVLKRKWREGESSPYTGKLSARPALVRPGDFLIAKESLRRSLPRHFPASASHHTGGPSMRFGRHGGIFLVRWGFKIKTKPWGGNRPPPDGRPQHQVKERAGRITLFLIVRR